MSNTLQTNNQILDKYFQKAFFAKYWRELCFQIIPGFILAFVFIFFTYDEFKEDPDVMMAGFLLTYLISMSLLTLLTNQFILNWLAKVKFKDFTLKFQKDGQILDRLSYGEALKLKMSFVWRRLLIYILAALFVFALNYILPEGFFSKLQNPLNIGLTIGGSLLCFYWTLRIKKKGQLMTLLPKTATI